MVCRGGEHTPVAPMLTQILDLIKSQPPGTTFSISIGTRSTDAADSTKDTIEAQKLAEKIAAYPVVILIHGLHAEESGAIDYFEKILAPIGSKRVFSSSDLDFNMAKDEFFAAARILKGK